MDTPEKPQVSPEKEELAKKTLEQLESLLDDWSNEVPDEIIRGGGKYKVRVNWWNLVTGNFYILLKKDLVNDEKLIKRMKGFLSTYAGRNYWASGHKRTTREDIVIADSLLEDVIRCLKPEQ